MKATVSEKGQVTIPKPLRERLGIKPGQVLEFRAESGRLVASKATARGGVDRVYGILRSKRSTDALIRSMRGEVDVV